MKKLVEFQIDSGGSIVFEVETPSEGIVEARRPGEVVQQAAKSLEDSLAGVKPIAEAIIKKLGDLAHMPNEIEVEFGLKLSAELGAIISSSTIEGNFAVKLIWSNPKRVDS